MYCRGLAYNEENRTDLVTSVWTHLSSTSLRTKKFINNSGLSVQMHPYDTVHTSIAGLEIWLLN